MKIGGIIYNFILVFESAMDSYLSRLKLSPLECAAQRPPTSPSYVPSIYSYLGYNRAIGVIRYHPRVCTEFSKRGCLSVKFNVIHVKSCALNEKTYLGENL